MIESTNLLFGVSLFASFLGGMVALFAPCCITFLFPSYLGTVFKEKRRIVFFTLVFALGLGFILVPVALGMKIIVTIFDQFHTTTYLLGALFMFLLGIMNLLNVKLMFKTPRYEIPEKTTIASTFILGVFSGITSSCCAPVLFGVITLSSLSPSIITSIIVSMVYVLGIVFPLFLLSLAYEKLTNQYLYKLKKTIEKPLKYLSSAVFILTSIIITYLALTDKIQMDKNLEYGTKLRTFIFNMSSQFQSPILDFLVLIGIVIFLIMLIREVKNENRK